MQTAPEKLQVRIHGDASLPTLIYLPGLHGDWTLVSSFRAAVAGSVRFVEFTYPRTLTWSLDDYARALEAELLAHGIEHGWLLGESFGSQPAWQLVARSLANEPGGLRPPPAIPHSAFRNPHSKAAGPELLPLSPTPNPIASSFRPDGVVLAGGFVRHPVIPGVRLMRRMNAAVPRSILQSLFRAYAGYARFRHRQAIETLDSIQEFTSNRLAPGDQAAIAHRLDLIASSDLRSVARVTRVPVHYLAGLVDPLVPWPFVRRWLRRHCPGYRGGRTVLNADHNVLATAPRPSARLVLRWMAVRAAGLSYPADAT